MAHEPPRAEEIRVPPPVLERAEQHPGFEGERGEIPCLLRRWCEGLLEEDVLAGAEAAGCEVVVGVGGRGDDDEGYCGVGEEGLGCLVVVRRGVVGGGGGAWLRVALDYGVEGEGGRGEDEGDVEDFGGVAWL